ncbi:unnamed protein product [Caenorhabditis bovis]|uniref:Major facilitator superfamily (MFS) profile domain-containing protein n=1 Tax=Caenorhabditis bovis TaxID=2654633 RepID=A0A8S1E6V2_9PELO|nr:unnamed protein product [Caenorhabditis bovis]
MKVSTEKPQRKISSVNFRNKTRILIMIIGLICVTIAQMNSLTFNFSVICMDDLKIANSTELHWIHDQSKISALFSATGIGAFIGLLPAVPLLSKFGVRYILTICGACSAVGTLLFPVAVDAHFYFAFLCRLLQGLGISIIFSVIGIIPVYWAPNMEMGTFLAILSCALQFSNIICMPVSGILCESSFGWRSIYYSFGVVTIIFYAIFFWFYADAPRVHRNVSEKELSRIENGKGSQQREAVPYIAVMTDLTVLMCWLSAFGGHVGFYLLILYGPTYLREVLHFDVTSTGFASALPFIFSAIVKALAGPLSDRLVFVSEKARFTICLIVSQFGMAAALVVMALTTNRTVAQIAYTLAITASGLNVMGLLKCCQIRACQHVHFVIAFISFCVCVIQFDNSPDQWSRLYIIVAILVVVTNIPFPFFTSDQPAEFTKTKNAKEQDISV